MDYFKISLENALRWLVGMVSPFGYFNDVYCNDKGAKSFVSSIGCPLIVGLCVNLIGLEFIGARNDKDPAYLLIFFVLLLLKVLITPAALSLMLAALSSRSSAREVLRCYTVFMLYYPLIAAFDLPLQWRTFKIAEYFWSNSLGMEDVASILSGSRKEAFFAYINKTSTFYPVVSEMGIAFQVFVTNLYCEALAQQISVQRSIIYVSTCTCVYFALLPQFILSLAQATAAMPALHGG